MAPFLFMPRYTLPIMKFDVCRSCLFFALLCASAWAQAEIYKSVDADGHVTYSSTPSKGAKRLGLEPEAPAPGYSMPRPHEPRRPRASASPPDFPKVDRSTQRYRDNARRKILEDELAAEEKLLAEARAGLKQAEASRAEAKLKTLREDVVLHEGNIGALKTELSSVK